MATARGGRCGGQAEADLARVQAHFQLDTGESGHEVGGALFVHLTVASQHRTGVVVLHVHDGEDVGDVFGQLVVPVLRPLEVDGLGCHRDDRCGVGPVAQVVQCLTHVLGVDAVFQVDVDAVEAVVLHEFMGGLGEVVGLGGVGDVDVADFATDGDDDLAALLLDRGDVVTELLFGVAVEFVGGQVEGDPARKFRVVVGEGDGDQVVLARDVCQWHDCGAVVEVVPVTGEPLAVLLGSCVGGDLGPGVRGGLESTDEGACGQERECAGHGESGAGRGLTAVTREGHGGISFRRAGDEGAQEEPLIVKKP